MWKSQKIPKVWMKIFLRSYKIEGRIYLHLVGILPFIIFKWLSETSGLSQRSEQMIEKALKDFKEKVNEFL